MGGVRNDEYLHRKQAHGGGGVNETYPLPVKVEELEARIGEAIADPAANTLLARIKQLETLLTALTGIDYATDTTLGALGTLLQSLDGKDFATEAELVAVKNELTAVKAELLAIKGNQLSGDQKVTLNGSIIEPRGSLANRPAPDDPSVTPYVTVYWAMDDGWTYGSDGTSWHKLVEVNTPWT